MDFVLKDSSGEIKINAFNEEIDKFQDLIQEGKVIFLSNARCQNVRNPQYNKTNHTYELTLQNQSVIEASMDRNNEIPSIEYHFVKIEDIANVPDKEKIDVLVVCTHVEQCVDQSLRSGRTTKKREIRVSDDSKTEIMLTLWGEKAEKYGESIIGKVLALRSVQVTDWNGKSLSCTFGTSLEIDPDIPPAKDLKDFYSDSINGSSNSSSNHDFKSLTTNDRGANTNMQSTEFVTLKQVHDDFQDAANLTRYYNLCAYLTDLKADKIMYKACPTEKCNKSVVDLGTGNYRCEKCAQEFANFHWRYILRGAIADPTDYQWITMFDDSASKIIGKTALEMATIKEESEINYRKVLNSAKYRQFNFLVKTSMESWNDEQRLKMSVANAELVNYKDEKHVKRLKADIEALKTQN